MSTETIKNGFLINYYRWATKQFLREFENDFVHLRTIHSCLPVIEFIEHLSEQKQAILISALLKRGHNQAVEMLGEIATPEETALLREYLAFMNHATTRFRADDFGIRTLDRRQFTKKLEAALAPTIGERMESGGPGYRRYIREFGESAVNTFFDTAGRIYQLQYDQRLLVNGILICDHISIVSWFGIASGSTGWKQVSDENSDSIIAAFRDICSMFMDAIPYLIPKN